MTDPCYELRENVMRLGRELKRSSLHSKIWPNKSFLTKEDILELKQTIEQMDEIEEDFKQAVFELADCVKRHSHAT